MYTGKLLLYLNIRIYLQLLIAIIINFPICLDNFFLVTKERKLQKHSELSTIFYELSTISCTKITNSIIYGKIPRL